MAHRLARAGAALAAMALLMLPTAASADSSHYHASPSADPHAGHDMGSSHDQHGEGSAGTADGHDAAPEDHTEHAPEPSEDAHDHGATTESDEGDHSDHGTTTEDDDAGHTDHGTEPDSVSPEVRNFVLSGFAGVNAAVIFGAWMVRRTGPDPDPRKRTPKASR